MNFNDFLEYRDGYLFWRVSLSPRAKVGACAGCVDKKSGYSRLRLKGSLYLAHRIVWEMLKGPIPMGLEVDHVNHNRSDNRIENLRLVTSTENSRNQKKHKTNTSGFSGVSWFGRDKKWKATIRVKDRTFFLGYFTDITEAVAARKAAEFEHGFHANHGASICL